MKKTLKNWLGISQLEEKLVELETRLKLIEILLSKQAMDVTRINELLSMLIMVHPQLKAKKIFDDNVSGSTASDIIDKLNKGELN